MSGINRTESMVGQTAMAAPSVLAVVSSWDQISVQDWLAIAGIIFIAFQAAYLAWRWHRDARREADRQADRQADCAASRGTDDDLPNADL